MIKWYLALICNICVGSLTNGSDLKQLSSDVTRDCGIANQRSTRIIGGSKADKFEFPWNVFLVIKYESAVNSSERHYYSCGASLIDPSWVLTAAHCIQKEGLKEGGKLRLKKYLVSLGDYNVDTINGEESIIVSHDIDALYPHPQFDKLAYGDYDVGLIRLSSPVQLNERISLLCLPTSGESNDISGIGVVNSGWGKVERNQDTDVLRKAFAEGISNEKCASYIPKRYHLTERMICTISDSSNHCMGDSGSPVVSKTTAGNYVQLGVVGMSFTDSKDHCLVGMPSVHTSVSKVLDWIKDTTQVKDFS